MRTWTRVTGASCALALAVILTGCDTPESSPGQSTSSSTPQDSTTFRLGQSSPEQESDDPKSSGATYTVTPTRVVDGTMAELADAGLDRDADDPPRTPVYVWTTITHKSGAAALRLGDIDDDLVVKTTSGWRTRALVVILGQAKWPDCPPYDPDGKLGSGQTVEICTPFLIPIGQKTAAVQLTQGFLQQPLEWPVKPKLL